MRDKAVLVEATILVDYLRESDAAAEYLDKARAEGDLRSSTVTPAELFVGSRTRGEIREIEQFLARFQNEPIASADSTRVLTWLRKYYHSRGVGFHDCLLGATAMGRNIPIATLNEKHFKALPGVKVVTPY